MDFNTTFDGRKCDHKTRIPLCCKTPLERTLRELPCLCSAQSPNMLVNLAVSRAVQAICAERSTSAAPMATETVERRLEQLMGHFCEIMRQRKEKGLQSTTWKYLRRSKKKRHNVPDSHRALHMHVLERDFSIRAACVQHDCATCASMQRDAVTAAQSRFLATFAHPRTLNIWVSDITMWVFLEFRVEIEYQSWNWQQRTFSCGQFCYSGSALASTRCAVEHCSAWRDTLLVFLKCVFAAESKLQL